MIVGRKYQAFLGHPEPFCLVHIKEFSQHIHVCLFKIIVRKLHLALVVNIPVLHPARPFQIIDIVDTLKVHGNPLNSIGDLRADRI